MKHNDFFDWLKDAEPGIVTLSPGPFIAKVDQNDVLGANYLRGMLAEMDDDATLGDYEAIILSHIQMRLEELAGESSEPLDGENVWKDYRIQYMLSSWWWLMFWARLTDGGSWHSLWEWIRWPVLQVWMWVESWRKNDE